MAATSARMTRFVLPIVLGLLLGAGVMRYWDRTHQVGRAAAPGDTAGTPADEAMKALTADVARLKTLTPSQSHSMTDVGEHWTDAWFAAQKKNWPLATFFLDETRQHIQWSVRIRPVRKLPDGSSVDLQPIFEAIDTSALKMVRDAIEHQSLPEFVTAYRATLEACYGCHKASAKPYLRPAVPTAPAHTIINFDPTATWPE